MFSPVQHRKVHYRNIHVVYVRPKMTKCFQQNRRWMWLLRCPGNPCPRRTPGTGGCSPRRGCGRRGGTATRCTWGSTCHGHTCISHHVSRVTRPTGSRRTRGRPNPTSASSGWWMASGRILSYLHRYTIYIFSIVYLFYLLWQQKKSLYLFPSQVLKLIYN